MKILCWLKGIWYSLTTWQNVKGHTFIQTEIHRNCTVYVDYCKDCGEVSITWEQN